MKPCCQNMREDRRDAGQGTHCSRVRRSAAVMIACRECMLLFAEVIASEKGSRLACPRTTSGYLKFDTYSKDTAFAQQ